MHVGIMLYDSMIMRYCRGGCIFVFLLKAEFTHSIYLSIYLYIHSIYNTYTICVLPSLYTTYSHHLYSHFYIHDLYTPIRLLRPSVLTLPLSSLLLTPHVPPFLSLLTASVYSNCHILLTHAVADPGFGKEGGAPPFLGKRRGLTPNL